ncbi:MAG: TIGR02147 family protein [Chitinispirillaceae bacterium]|nr:TIGR02147 family protein [Chitinispirillaceae bacterium]
MKPIFDYSDYRLFLRDYLSTVKSHGTQLTYEELGRRVGFTSKGFVTQILQGKSNIPKEKISRFAGALGLKKREADFFELLVRFNQAKTHRAKNETFKELVTGFKTRIRHIGPEKYEFYSAWYYSAVRSLLGYYRFDGDYAKLAQQLIPAITPRQAKKAIDLLERLSLIEKDDEGMYRLTARLLTTGDTVDSLALVNFQQNTMDLAKEALETVHKDSRHGSTLTLGLSPEGYRQAVDKIAQLRKDLLSIAQFDRHIDRVIQVNLHAFPLTKLSKGKK